MIKNKTLFNSL